MSNEIVWIIISYFVGFFPIAYLIGKRVGVDLGKVGAQKFSGSNVIKQIGARPGIFVGLVDLSKGVIAVAGAKYFQFSETGIILSGLAAIVGQDWPIFPRFHGGRGLATTLGAAFMISPQIEIFPFLLFMFSGVIKHMGLGTIFMFAAMISVSAYFQNFLFLKFSILASLVALLARLIAVGKPRPKTFSIILNRLLFDHD